jgi:catechol 2,3-dioxygenase-like lactoylglutathione lyase family enzyme
MADTAAAPSVVKVTGIHHISIPCNDLDRAVRFYTEVLGMEFVRRFTGDTAPHFLGTNLPAGLEWDNALAAREYREYLETYELPRPGGAPGTTIAQLRAGRDQVDLFLRPAPVERDTLAENGVFHQSFHVSAADMTRLAELKARGDSGIRFSNGPTLRWPHGRALYLWDSEGNYIELESDEDLRAEFGQPASH